MPVDLARYMPSGRLLAIAPSALGAEFPVVSPPLAGVPLEAYRMVGAAGVVDITGPINYIAGTCDTYGYIRERVAAAIADQAVRFVVLRIHSPGGEVAGAFDTSRALRAMCAEARKPLIAFSEADMCSAAYALGSAGYVVVSSTANVGSIGVLSAHAEFSRAENAAGLTWAILASGARKADGNPHMPFSEAAIASMQRHVDENAAVFFQLVREHRGISIDQIEGLQGRVLLGAQAVAEGLADQIMSWDQLIAAIGAPGAEKIFAVKGASAQDGAIEAKMAKAEDKKEDKPDLSALMAEAESDDLEKRARARKALRAYFSDSEPDGDKDDAPKGESADDADEGKKAAKAESADDADESRRAQAGAQARGALDATAMSLAQQVSAQAQELAAMRAERAAEKAAQDASALAALKASRPDLAQVFAATPDLSLAQVQQLIGGIKAPQSFYVDPVAGAAHGSPQHQGGGGYDPQLKEGMARAFNRQAAKQGVENAGYRQIFHPHIPLVNSAAAANAAAAGTAGK